MTVKKGNRIKQVDAIALPRYLKQGYDEIDEKGNVIKRATGGRLVSVAELNKALEQVDELKQQNAELKKEVKSLRKG